MPEPTSTLLGQVAPDHDTAANERTLLRGLPEQRGRLLRNQFVTITDAETPNVVFLGRILNGPFFPAADGQSILAEIEIQGELTDGRLHETNNRPTPGSPVQEMPTEAVSDLLGFAGDLLLGCMAGREDLPISLNSKSKDVLPRNVGIFGTVGAGKSNSVQVLVEEAAAAGWAVVMLDLEGEYIDMDQPTNQADLIPRLARFGRAPRGLADFHVYYPVCCTSDRQGSQPFTLRLADFERSVISELLQTSMAERNALLDTIDYFEQKLQSRLPSSEAEVFLGLLDPSPQAKLPYTLPVLRGRVVERSPRSNETLDFVGLASKLQLLTNTGAFDQQGMKGLAVAELLKPGRVNVIDVSMANDTIKNLVTADLLRKTFAWKIAKPEAPPTLVVIEEAHSFMSREKIQTMQATLQMLRNVTRRGRKRWLSLAFVSQQPGHLPQEIFELCNTRLVHTLRSMHNLEALMATTGDITRELWARCPLLGTGEVILSSPQLKRAVVMTVRPAGSRRRFVR